MTSSYKPYKSRHMILMCLFLMYAILMPSTSTGQTSDIWTPEAGLYLGRVVRHNQGFNIPISEPTFIFEASLYQWKTGTEDWHHRLLYPQIGISAQYIHLGDQDILGRGLSLIPNITFNTGRSPYGGLTVRLGMGLAYLTRPFDIIDNPKNIAIGSHLNNATHIYLAYRYQISQRSFMSLGAGLTHFSNGKFKSPNKGINIFAGQFTYQHTLRTFEKAEVPTTTINKPHHYAIYKFSMGAHDRGPGTPVHPVYLHNISYAYRISSDSYLWLGLTYAFDRAEYHNMLFIEYNGSDLRRLDAADLSLSLGYELRVGSVGLMAQTGYYLYDPAFNNGPYYFKLGFNYYLFNAFDHIDTFLFTNIKSHLAIADYFELGVGMRLF